MGCWGMHGMGGHWLFFSRAGVCCFLHCCRRRGPRFTLLRLIGDMDSVFVWLAVVLHRQKKGALCIAHRQVKVRIRRFELLTQDFVRGVATRTPPGMN